MPTLVDGQTNPSCGERAAEMAMGKQRNVTLQCGQITDESVGARGNVLGHFTTWATVLV